MSPTEAQTTGLDVASFVIALLAFLLAVGSLAWQAATYVLSGGRVKVELMRGLARDSGGDMLTRPESMTPDTLQRLAAEGYTRPVIGVLVRNVGRMPVTVSGWSLNFSVPGAAYRPLGAAFGPPMPHRLEAGASEAWVADERIVQATANTLVKATTEPISIRGKIELGDGRSYESRESQSYPG